jgi:hypothetical protein
MDAPFTALPHIQRKVNMADVVLIEKRRPGSATSLVFLLYEPGSSGGKMTVHYQSKFNAVLHAIECGAEPRPPRYFPCVRPAVVILDPSDSTGKGTRFEDNGRRFIFTGELLGLKDRKDLAMFDHVIDTSLMWPLPPEPHIVAAAERLGLTKILDIAPNGKRHLTDEQRAVIPYIATWLDHARPDARKMKPIRPGREPNYYCTTVPGRHLVNLIETFMRITWGITRMPVDANLVLSVALAMGLDADFCGSRHATKSQRRLCEATGAVRLRQRFLPDTISHDPHHERHYMPQIIEQQYPLGRKPKKDAKRVSKHYAADNPASPDYDPDIAALLAMSKKPTKEMV